jgi:protein-S-isoprenylcysteine O-methyltransferase Ste14
MHAFVAAGAAFLLAVLWFDLMFDVQTRKHLGEVLPDDVLTSISSYYRRVTTEAFPMNRLVAAVMLATLIAIGAEIVAGASPWWVGWGSLVIAGSGMVPSLTKTVPNAKRLGTRLDSPEEQSLLARGIYRAHVGAFLRMATVLVLQLGFGR